VGRRSPKSDPQREELYRAEKALRGLTTAEWGRREIKAKVASWSRKYGVPVPAVVFAPLRGFYGTADADPDRLTFATDVKGGRSPLTVVHEFAHHVMWQRDPDSTFQSHGPEFVRVMGTVLDDAGIVPRAGWEEACDRYGVEYA
jgi:hypothetical protein